MAYDSRTDQRPTFRITFTPTPAGPAPPIHALRRLLKCLLREYHFRALLVEELPADSLTQAEAEVLLDGRADGQEAFAGWHRPHPSHPWRRVLLGTGDEEAVARALVALRLTGDTLLLPAGVTPNAVETAR